MSCVEVSTDGHVYVCDRRNNRIQVFRKDGTFVKEAVVSKATLGEGSVWDVAFSQRSAAAAISSSPTGRIRRFSCSTATRSTVVSSFGGGGRWPGGFYGVGSVAVDSKGNVYTGENFEGKRLQKFVNR